MTAPDPVTRRRLLQRAGAGLLGGAAVVTLAACGLRLDRPPPPPPVPTRRPAPDEALLVAVVRDLVQLVAAEEAIDSSVVEKLVGLHREQVTVLTGRLTNLGVPTNRIAGGTGGAASGSTPRTTAALAQRLSTVADERWVGLAAATADNRMLLTAAFSQRLAGAVLLGRPVPLATTASPAREAILERTRPLVYAFEVVAAQSAGDQRERAVGTLTTLRGLEAEAAATSSTAPTGWALPFPVTDGAAARRLATSVLATAVASLADVIGAAPTAAAVEDVASWGARVQAVATGWSVPLTAFPGADG